MTEALRSHFADYAAFHRTPGNKTCHSLGIPIIVLSSLALLARVPLFAVGGFTVTLAEILIVLFVAYYLTLDLTLAAFMLAGLRDPRAAGPLHPCRPRARPLRLRLGPAGRRATTSTRRTLPPSSATSPISRSASSGSWPRPWAGP